MRTINMMSSADKIKGQGVGSAYEEQVNLVSCGLKDDYKIYINSKKKCDIIHFHTINPEYWLHAKLDQDFFAHVGYVHFLPETVDESLDIPGIGKKIFYKYMIDFYKKMDYLVTVNPYFIDELEKYGINRNKVTYIPNYVSEKNFYTLPQEKINFLKEKYKISTDKFIVLGVGQVQTRKGIMDFIKTASLMPEAEFIWAGGFSFGAMTDGYKELKEIMENPPQNVKFTGIVERENMNDIYNICDVMFLPSYSELFPMTILESMCVGKPILLRDLDIYKNILFDYYLKGSNINDFYNILKKLSSDKQFYRKWQNNSLEGHKFYSYNHVIDLWKNFYDRVYEESQAKSLRLIKNKEKIKVSRMGKVKKVYSQVKIKKFKRNILFSIAKIKKAYKIYQNTVSEEKI